jgi:GntR family transcriptional regulator
LALELQLVTGNSTPLYRQIVEQVRLAVATGALQPGEQLPSVRAVAERLVINPNTVARAYADLTRDGVVEAQPGKGLYVAERRVLLSDEERLRRLNAARDEFIQAVLFLGFRPAEILEGLEQRLQEMESSPDREAQKSHG